MASNYHRFAFEIPMQPLTAPLLQKAIDILDVGVERDMAAYYRDPSLERILPGIDTRRVPGPVRALAEKVFAYVAPNAADPEQMEYDSPWSAANLILEYEDDAIYVYCEDEEPGNPDVAAALVQVAQEELGVGPIAFEWTAIDPSSRTGGFGGGAAVILPGEQPKMFSSGQWVEQHMPKSDLEAEAPSP